MGATKISVFSFNSRTGESELLETHIVVPESDKRFNAKRASKALAAHLPEYIRQKGRNSIFAGIEVLPVMEKHELGWVAWRLASKDKTPSGYQPPLKGATGKLNQKDNPFCDRKKGEWQFAIVSPH